MKVYIAYESKFGNGKKCVDYLQIAIAKKGHSVESSSIREIKSKSLQLQICTFLVAQHT